MMMMLLMINNNNNDFIGVKKLYSSRVVKQDAKFVQSKGEVSTMLFENSNLNLKTKEK